jgi:hypothetical protein
MVDELRKMLKFAALSPGAAAVQGGLISPAEKRELYMIYQANSLVDGASSDESTAALELLKTVIGLGEGALV